MSCASTLDLFNRARVANFIVAVCTKRRGMLDSV